MVEDRKSSQPFMQRLSFIKKARTVCSVDHLKKSRYRVCEGEVSRANIGIFILYSVNF